MRASDGSIESDWTGLGTAYTLAAAPAAEPLANVSATAVTARWGHNLNPVGTRYLCECYVGPGFDVDNRLGDSGWTTNTEFEFTGLDPNTLYTFRVRARNGDFELTSWTPLGSTGVYTLAAVPGALSLDMRVFVGGRTNPDGPAPGSLGLVGLDLNGNPDTTQFAIRVGPTQWLRLDTTTANPDDLDAGSATPEWFTAVALQGKRLRRLQPNTQYTFTAVARNAPQQETTPTEVATESTSREADVNRSGRATALDYALIRAEILRAAGTFCWPCNVVDDLSIDVNDLNHARGEILNPTP